MTPEQIAGIIDHTLLSAVSTESEIVRICQEAKQYGFATVCVNPYWVPIASHELAGSKVGLTTVIGFPLGASRTEIKAAEAADAIMAGATEIDMVLNIGALKSGHLSAVQRDIEEVVKVCKGKAIVKVIIETCYLTDEEKQKAALICKQAGADFVKTSTGFGTGGATVEDIALIRHVIGPDMGIKASGGVRDLDISRKLIQAGATRLGASSSLAIITGGGTGQGY
jgi:deoxyribose-phosphate aldolase